MLKAKHIPTPLTPPDQRPSLPIFPIKRPSRLRWIYLLRRVLGFFARLGLLRLRRRLTPVIAAREFRTLLEQFGGVWLKLGQLLAMRNDLFSRAFCDELSQLQERAYAFSFEEARGIVETALGYPIATAFDEFGEAPLAAASFAQVHKARLRNEQIVVAVKVQKPYAELYFAYDVGWLSSAFYMLTMFGVARNVHWADMLKELKQMIAEELDYRYEAVSLRQLRKTLKPHGVYAPKLFDTYCADKVLVMEFLRGVSVAEFIATARRDPARAEAWLRENEIDRSKVAQRLLTSMLRQIFEDNLHHADPHPGNILLLRGGRLALIDFGSVGSLDPEFLALYSQYLFALSAGAYVRAVDLLLTLSAPVPNVDFDELRRALTFSMRQWARRTAMRTVPFHERSLSSSSEDIGRIQGTYHFDVNWFVLRVGRAFSVMDMTLGLIDPDISYPKEIQRYYAKAMQRKTQRRLQALLRLPQTIENAAAQVVPRVRESLVRFRSGLTKAEHLVGEFLRLARGAVVVAAVYFTARMFGWALPGLPAPAHLRAAAPGASPSGGWLMIAGLVLLGVYLHFVFRRFRQPSAEPPKLLR